MKHHHAPASAPLPHAAATAADDSAPAELPDPTPDLAALAEDEPTPNLPFPPAHLFWLYLLLIATIEAATTLTTPHVGLLAYGGLLLVLTLHSNFGRQDGQRMLALVLALVPFARMLMLTLPLVPLPLTLWYPLVLGVLFLAALLTVHQSGLSLPLVGLVWRDHAFHLMMSAGGLGFGTVLYLLLPQPALNNPLLWGFPLPLALLLVLLSATTTELIFRGAVQAAALPLMGRWGLLYGALVFAVLHIGYLSVPAVLFAFVLGLLLAHLAQHSGSLLGVTLLHGSTQVTHLLLLPALVPNHVSLVGMLAWLTSTDALLSVAFALMLALLLASLSGLLLLLSYLCAPA